MTCLATCVVILLKMFYGLNNNSAQELISDLFATHLLKTWRDKILQEREVLALYVVQTVLVGSQFLLCSKC